MLLQQRDNLLPGFLAAFLPPLLTALLPPFLTTSGFCLRVFSRSPTFDRFSGSEEHGYTPYNNAALGSGNYAACLQVHGCGFRLARG